MNSCARCGAELQPDKAGGLCVRCLLQGGLETIAPPSPGGEPSNAPPSVPTSFPDLTTRRLGEYELLEEIARGGMGVVYKARQPSLERIVALKMILAGQFASKEVIQRFRGEVTAAALLQHPNIVAIHDVGIHDDQHYFSMDYVAGQSLSQLVGNRPLPVEKAARYVQVIAEAIHYAHGQGILHRDLKPSNVLIDSSTDQPRITDFGLAKRLDGNSSLTITGQVLGSPNFMPPEQAGGKQGKVGRQSDVYGLGAILYYLLTARPPFQAESLEGIMTQVLQSEPISPRALNPGVPRDLETICLKCLSKAPAGRYSTAEELAGELGRFLRHQPIEARPVTQFEKTWRWCRRKPAIAGLGASTLLLLLALAVGSPVAALRIRRERDRADQSLYDTDMKLAQLAWDDGDLGLALSRLQAHLPARDRTDRRGFEWYYFWNTCRGDHLRIWTNSQAVSCVALSPDGKRLAIGAVRNPVQIRDCATGKLLMKFPEPNIASLAFAPDGGALAVGGQDQLNVWDLETQGSIFEYGKPLARFQVAFSSRERLLIAGTTAVGRRFAKDHGSVELWDYGSHALRHSFPNDSGGYLALSPLGDRLLTGNATNHTTMLWDLTTMRLIQTLNLGNVIAICLSPDGQTLATSDTAEGVKFWDINTGQIIGGLTNYHDQVWSLAWSPEGLLATAGMDQVIRLWEPTTGREVEQLRGHASEVLSVAFSADGQTLASGSRDQTARLWSVHPNRPATTVPNVKSRHVFSPDSRFVAAGVDPAGVAVWDTDTLERRWFFADAFDPVAFSLDNRRLTTRGTNYFLRTFDLDTGAVIETIAIPAVAEFESNVAISPDGKIVTVGFADGDLTFFDATTGGVIASNPRVFSGHVFQMVFSPDGSLLAAAGRESEAGRPAAAIVWDVATHKLIKTLEGHGDVVLSVGFFPDGKTLATSSADTTIRFWETSGWKEILSPIGQKEAIISLALSPDGKTLAAIDWAGTLKLWSVATRRELFSMKTGGYSQYISFSPDGQTLGAYTGSAVLRLWRAPRQE